MFRYSAKIRLGGSVLNEVRKTDMSPAEVIIMRRIHGDDMVVDLVETQREPTPEEKLLEEQGVTERPALEAKYGRILARETPPTSFDILFGPSHMDLPPRLLEFAKTAAAKAAKPAKPVETATSKMADIVG